MDKRAAVVNIVKGQYRNCQVIDMGRALLLIPPADGRYGMLPLEAMISLSESCYRSERTLQQEVTIQMSGSTRALPDTSQQVLNVLGFDGTAQRTAQEAEPPEVFLRFGVMTEATEVAKLYYSKQTILKIVPPRYATDMQIILKVRSNEESEVLTKLMRKAVGRRHRKCVCSNARVRGYSYIFGVVRIAQEFMAVRDRVEYYWELVNNPSPSWQDQRKFINCWMAGVDFK